MWSSLCILLSFLTICQASPNRDAKINKFFDSKHTNNWAVLVCSSRYWFNYRHVANVLSLYRSVKRLGIPDSRIILMLADDMPCNARNPRPATVFNNAHHHINVYGDDVEVDYRGECVCCQPNTLTEAVHFLLCIISNGAGYEVTVQNFIRLLTGRVQESTPKSRRLLTDAGSNILIYMTGHGGDGFLKFQDSEEITSIELADAFEQMRQKQRYNEILLITETCQAESMAQKLYSSNILAVGSSKVGEDSLSHHGDPTIGVYIIDRYTYYALEFLEKVSVNSSKSVGQFLSNVCPKRLCISSVAVRSDLFQRDLNRVPLTDFFGSVPQVQLIQVPEDEEQVRLKADESGKPVKAFPGSESESLVYADFM